MKGSKRNLKKNTVKLNRKQRRKLGNALSQMFSKVDSTEKEYIDNPNKPNECVNLGTAESHEQAHINAMEFMKQRYPYIKKADLWDVIFEPDSYQDYFPEDGEPTFLYKIQNDKLDCIYILIFEITCGLQCHNCKHCDFDENIPTDSYNHLCKKHKKTVKYYDMFCPSYEHRDTGILYSKNNPYAPKDRKAKI